jgi:hypothetical protein
VSSALLSVARRHHMDDQIAVRFLHRHDLEFPTAFIVSDPAEHSRSCIRIGGDGGIGRGDHVIGGLSADSVFAGSPSEPDRLHPHIVSDINLLCKAQHHSVSVPITRITGDRRQCCENQKSAGRPVR